MEPSGQEHSFLLPGLSVLGLDVEGMGKHIRLKRLEHLSPILECLSLALGCDPWPHLLANTDPGRRQWWFQELYSWHSHGRSGLSRVRDVPGFWKVIPWMRAYSPYRFLSLPLWNNWIKSTILKLGGFMKYICLLITWLYSYLKVCSCLQSADTEMHINANCWHLLQWDRLPKTSKCILLSKGRNNQQQGLGDWHGNAAD